MKKHVIFSLGFAAILLTGCIEQSVVDEKMVRGCVAGVNSLLPSGKITEVSSTNVSTKDFEFEGPHRFVEMTVVKEDGWIKLEEKYNCVFLEQWGFMKKSHSAVLIQLDMNGEVYGKQDGVIRGDVEGFITITNAVGSAMGQ